MERRLLPVAERAAAEPDVAWLASEATATLCAERLKPLRQRSDSHEQPRQDVPLCSLRRHIRTDGPAGLPPVPALPTCVLAAAKLSCARYDHLSAKHVL